MTLAQRLAGEDFFDDFFTRASRLPQGVRYHENEDEQLVVSFDVPGVSKEDLKATVRNNSVSVSADTETRNYLYQVSVRGVNTDKVDHSLENGVLTLTFSKAESLKERNILA